jgi:hypothetical protein
MRFESNLVLLTVLLLPSSVLAGVFRSENLFDSDYNLQGIYNFDVAYGARYRLEDRDPALIAQISGGSNLQNSLLDDGNLNYDNHQFVSNMVRANGELTLRLGPFGAFVRGYAFYDYENDHNERARTPLSGLADDQVSRDARFLDAYLSAQFTVAGLPVQLRVGDQIVAWGQSTFFSTTGVNVINPLNVPLAQQPTSTPQDLRLPVGMVWGAIHLTPLVSLEAFYQYEWESTVIPAKGTYLSGNDIVPGIDSAQFTGTASDLGTDVCARFGLDPNVANFQDSSGQDPTKIKALEPPPGLDEGGDGCYDFLYLKARAIGNLEPKNGGQYGFTLQSIIPKWNDSKIAFHFANYHSQLPYLSGYTVSQEALVASRENTLFNVRNGLLSLADATEFGFANVTKQIELLFEYPEDIQMYGLSFNTTTIRTGTAFSGEIAHHRNHPFQLHVGQVAPGLLNLTPPGHPGFPDGEYSPPYQSDVFIRSWIELDKTQLALGVTQLLGPQLGASQVALSLEAAYLYIHDMPDKDNVRLQTPGVALLQFEPQDLFADANSWGYRLAGVATYSNVFGSLEVSPRVVFSHDVQGNSPIGQPFQEDRKALTLGVNTTYIDRFSAGLSYTSFFGAGDYNVLNDRDFLNFNMRYSF